MCGRYRLTAKERWLSTYFNLDPEDVEWVARWNIAPTQDVATIRQDRREPKRKFALMRVLDTADIVRDDDFSPTTPRRWKCARMFQFEPERDRKLEEGVFRRGEQKAGTAGFTPHTMINAPRLVVDEIAGIQCSIIDLQYAVKKM